jgi:hypothetical protein
MDVIKGSPRLWALVLRGQFTFQALRKGDGMRLKSVSLALTVSSTYASGMLTSPLVTMLSKA